MRGMRASQYTDLQVLCTTDKDKNSNKHTERMSEKGRETETAGYEKDGDEVMRADSRLRYVQSPAVSWAALASCLAAF